MMIKLHRGFGSMCRLSYNHSINTTLKLFNEPYVHQTLVSFDHETANTRQISLDKVGIMCFAKKRPKGYKDAPQKVNLTCRQTSLASRQFSSNLIGRQDITLS